MTLLDDLRGVRRPPASSLAEDPVALAPPIKPETAELRQQMLNHFQQWVALYQRSPKLDAHFGNYIRELDKNRVLNTDDVATFFFRVCTEASVGHYVKSMATDQFEYSFHALDAYARLVAMLVRFQGDKNGMGVDQAKVHYLAKILSIVILVLAHMHEEQGDNFQQKPFFRFFSGLVNDLHAMRSSLGSVYFRLLTTIRYSV